MENDVQFKDFQLKSTEKSMKPLLLPLLKLQEKSYHRQQEIQGWTQNRLKVHLNMLLMKRNLNPQSEAL